MRPLFTTVVCDSCDGLAPAPEYYSGFIVWQPDRVRKGRTTYVFRSRNDAALWRSDRDLQDCEIRKVLCEFPIRWRLKSGTLQGVEMADRPFEVFEDHRFPPAPNRVVLAVALQRDAA